MNRYREDTPYEFHPPKYSRFWAPLIRLLNEFVWLRRLDKVAEVRVSGGGERLLTHCRKGDALLITPNHSDHADPHVLLHLSRRYRVPIHFIAARETFELAAGLQGFMMQRIGAFSIDREGSDLRAIKESIRILTKGDCPLVMFPEGEIYHVNQKLTPLNEGAATLALRAARKVLKDGGTRRAYIVPTALKYRYIDDIAATFAERMARLEKHIMWAPQQSLDILERIYKFGKAALTLKEIEYLGAPQDGDLTDRLERFRETIVSREEQHFFGKVESDNHPVRIRRLRGKIRTILLDDERPPQEVIDRCYLALDRLYFALQLYSYPGGYISAAPSADRIAETIHKFEEDVFGENDVKGRRRVEVTFCDPIDLSEQMEAMAKDTRATVTAVTERIEKAIRDVLET